MKKTHRGSKLDDLLAEERLLEAAMATATKRVIAQQIATEMKRRRLTKMAMASRMKTSRAALDRLLDPKQPVGDDRHLGKGRGRPEPPAQGGTALTVHWSAFSRSHLAPIRNG